MGNGYGDARHSRSADFAAYDEMHPLARGLLQDADANWSSPFILSIWDGAHRAGASLETCCVSLQRFLARSAAEDIYRTYGPDHPHANAHGQILLPDEHRLWRAGRRARRAS